MACSASAGGGYFVRFACRLSVYCFSPFKSSIKTICELTELASTNGLTGLANHRAFQTRLLEEISRAIRHQTPLSLMMIDVDRFKQYNDSFGHPEGDIVLKVLADVLSAYAREADASARYGGEEFVVILPLTDIAGALRIAERIRGKFEMVSGLKRVVTVSLGVAELSISDSGGSDLIRRADRALYRSKANGRNLVTAATGHDSGKRAGMKYKAASSLV